MLCYAARLIYAGEDQLSEDNAIVPAAVGPMQAPELNNAAVPAIATHRRNHQPNGHCAAAAAAAAVVADPNVARNGAV